MGITAANASINTGSAQKVLVLGRVGGEGCVEALRYTPSPLQISTGVCGKPSDEEVAKRVKRPC